MCAWVYQCFKYFIVTAYFMYILQRNVYFVLKYL